MTASLLETLLGGDRAWSPPCVVVLTAEADVRAPGPDSIGGGGIKTYAPRYASGRVEADSCCLLTAENALLILRQTSTRDGTGEVKVRHSLLFADLAHVVGVEFAHLKPLAALGLPTPLLMDQDEYRPGTLVG